MSAGYDGGAPGGSGAAELALRDLVLAATVRIHRAGAGYAHDEPVSFLGSGFFVAPNWVLTCAHVVHAGEGGEVTVVYRTSPYDDPRAVPGRVAAMLPELTGRPAPGNWPAPDLALVRLREPVGHTCVYVSERPNPHFGGTGVFYAGWTAPRGRLQILDGRLTVQGTISAWSPEEQVRLGQNDLPSGVSGGPVVDPVRGEVVGVLKSRADHGGGGTSIGVERLRTLRLPADGNDVYQSVFHAHDRYHRDRQQAADSPDPTWADIQGELGARPGRTLGPHQRSELLGLLADLPPPVSTRALLDVLRSLPDFRVPSLVPAPRGWRDGLGLLYEHARQDGALKLVLDYAMGVLSAERPPAPSALAAERALWDWVRHTAAGLDSGYRHALAQRRAELLGRAQAAHRRAACGTSGGAGKDTAVLEPVRPLLAKHPEPSVLLVVLRRGWEPDHCDWSVSVGGGPDQEPTRLYEGERAPLDGLVDHVAAPLAEAFRHCDEPGRPATLYVALPHLHLGLPVDDWRLAPDGAPLGAERPVLVRCSDRDQLPDEEPSTRRSGAAPWETDGAEDPDAERRDRWRRLHLREAQAEVLDCDDGVRRPVPEAAALRGLAPYAVPVLCRPGDPRSTDDPAALGRVLRAGFGVVLWHRRRRPDAVCGEFHRGVKTVVDDGDGALFLPGAVHALRGQVGAEDTESYWAHGLAILYDDPHRPLPGTGDLLEAP
ncbi:VMAP-C domain-containing protein [Streptomyces sp. NBC_01601]|uniref:VMAP-C domain-containing protein n=1 Tax=Streptomyces sp. NBC_01601 TaxID=2975892 RepID=UPI002E2A393F|nr:trypsin-like peptidase domain-containing protein [Streptomyces sp. NBC_01601]